MATEIRLYCICGASISAVVPQEMSEKSPQHVQRVQDRFRRQHSGKGHRLIHRAEWLAKQNQETIRLSDTLFMQPPDQDDQRS